MLTRNLFPRVESSDRGNLSRDQHQTRVTADRSTRKDTEMAKFTYRKTEINNERPYYATTRIKLFSLGMKSETIKRTWIFIRRGYPSFFHSLVFSLRIERTVGETNSSIEIRSTFLATSSFFYFSRYLQV